MAYIKTKKDFNLQELDKSLGSQGLSAEKYPDEKGYRQISTSDQSTITMEELQTAIEAHIAGPNEEEIRVLNRQQGLAKLKELGFTDDEITALIS